MSVAGATAACSWCAQSFLRGIATWRPSYSSVLSWYSQSHSTMRGAVPSLIALMRTYHRRPAPLMRSTSQASVKRSAASRWLVSVGFLPRITDAKKPACAGLLEDRYFLRTSDVAKSQVQPEQDPPRCFKSAQRSTNWPSAPSGATRSGARTALAKAGA